MSVVFPATNTELLNTWNISDFMNDKKKITIVNNNNSSAVHPVNSFELLLTFSYLDDLDDITLTFGKRSVIAW